MRRALPFALLLLAGCEMPATSASMAAIPEEFQGFWATDIYAQCPNHAAVGTSEDAPIAINSSQIIGTENTCTVLQAVRGGEGILTAQMSCTGEGVTEEVTATLYRSGRALTFNRGEGSVLWSRCPVMLREETPAPEAAAGVPLDQAAEEDAGQDSAGEAEG